MVHVLSSDTMRRNVSADTVTLAALPLLRQVAAMPLARTEKAELLIALCEHVTPLGAENDADTDLIPRLVREIAQARQGARRRVGTDPRAAQVPQPWRIVAGPVTRDSRRATEQIKNDMRQDAIAIREKLWPSWVAMSRAQCLMTLGLWRDPPTGGSSTATLLSLHPDEIERLRCVHQSVRRFARNYWRRSGGLWSTLDVLVFLLSDILPPRQTLPALTARPVPSGVQPLGGGRELEMPPYLVHEVTPIVPAATREDVWALWKKIHPQRAKRGARRSETHLAALAEVMQGQPAEPDWLAVADAFYRRTRYRCSSEALRRRWARRPR